MTALANSRSAVNSSKINLDNQQALYDRNLKLIEKGVISKMEFESIENNYLNTLEQYNSAVENLKIIKYGFSNVSNPNT